MAAAELAAPPLPTLPLEGGGLVLRFLASDCPKHNANPPPSRGRWPAKPVGGGAPRIEAAEAGPIHHHTPHAPASR